jgi:queuosine biosynthesis protein QueD
MRCLECGAELERIDNEHLLQCSGLTVQEYALRHHLPLDLILHPDQLDAAPDPGSWPAAAVREVPQEARAVLCGLWMCGRLAREGDFCVVRGEIRRLDLLLWAQARLDSCGFRFLQTYHYRPDGHRVTARNTLQVPVRVCDPFPVALPEDPERFLDAVAVFLAFGGEWHADYLFLPAADADMGRELALRLEEAFGIRLLALDEGWLAEGVLLRSLSPDHTWRLLNLLDARLDDMPGVLEQFAPEGPEATITKVFEIDAAHFITDHPGRCVNLHGGRYALHVRVTDRIQPATGFVMDYGDLKALVRRRVIDRLDHQNLNYVDAGLAWRSSTELLATWIWERLIDYLPGLSELVIHETASSYCRYVGPDLESFRREGSSPLLGHFTDPRLGRSAWRARLREQGPALKVVGED